MQISRAIGNKNCTISQKQQYINETATSVKLLISNNIQDIFNSLMIFWHLVFVDSRQHKNRKHGNRRECNKAPSKH